MKMLSSYVIGLAFSTCTVCVAQVDIYQSDAYSVEEMCAQEAEQSNAKNYSDAYETCIEKNRDKKMYQPDRIETEADDQEHSLEHSEETVPEDDTELPVKEADGS